MTKWSPADWHEARALASLPIPHIDLILEECFRVPPHDLFPEAPRPQTVGELARYLDWSLERLQRELGRFHELTQGLEVEADALKAEPVPLLLDVREESEWEQDRVDGAMLLARESMQDLMPRLKAASRVIVLCQDGRRSFSAALYLRMKEVPNAHALRGGLNQLTHS